MMKPVIAAALVLGSLTSGGLADGSGGHSHPHVHPHQAHAVHGDASAEFQHTHGASGVGVSHAHEINGVMLQHTHSTQMSARKTAVDRWNRKLVQREIRLFGGRQVGAGFGPYSVAEYEARLRAGQPGLANYQEPWPTRRYRQR